MMKFLKLGKGPVGVGCGYLYGMPVKDFKVGKTTYKEMTEIGYISDDGATFRRTGEMTAISTASDGIVGYFPSGYETEFETSTISLTKDNMTLYTTGSETVDNEDGTYTIYGCEDDVPANLALCFRGEDKSGTKFELYMPNATWSPDLEMVFDAENPIALNMTFSCGNTSLGNGKTGSYYIVTNLGAEDAIE